MIEQRVKQALSAAAAAHWAYKARKGQRDLPISRSSRVEAKIEVTCPATKSGQGDKARSFRITLQARIIAYSSVNCNTKNHIVQVYPKSGAMVILTKDN